jgi:predicted phosphodiesterase
MKTYNFIACADLHLRDSIPHARTDDYWKAQEKKFRFLIDTANEKNCDIYCAGDFFHRAKSSSFLEAWIIEQLQDLKNEGLKFHVIPGQHDLPNHNIELLEHSSLWVLRQAEVIDLSSTPFEQPFFFEDHGIMLIHKMIHQDIPIPGVQGSTKAIKLLKDNPEARIIISGDNHRPFIEYTNNKRGLINCGSMMRMSADQIDYYPAFYYIEMKDTIIVHTIPYPIEKDVIDRSYIEIEKERDNRVESFVNRFGENDAEMDLNFEKNLENFFRSQKIRKPVQEICWEALEK